MDPPLNNKLLFPVICIQTPHSLHVTLGGLREELEHPGWGGLVEGFHLSGPGALASM